MAKINFWKIICEAFGKNWKCCSYYWDTVTLCKATGLLARKECPEKEEKRLKKRNAPKEYCSIHLPPPPPPPKPKWEICRETGREATPWCQDRETVYEQPAIACRKHTPFHHPAVPLMVLFSVYPHCKYDETNEELELFANRIGAAGVDYVRVFSGWRGEPEDQGFVVPFLKKDGKFDLNDINPEYIQLLQRFQRFLAKAGVGILFDFFPSQLCRAGYPFAFWHRDNNVSNIDSVYDTRPHAIAHFCSWIKTVYDAIGVEGNLFKFGNEQQAPGDNLDGTGRTNDVNEIKRWAEGWVDPIAQFVRSIGVAGPMSCSCEPYPGTGHKISNYLCEAGWGFEWPWDQVINHIHCGTLSLWQEAWLSWPERRYSLRKHYGISDDGIGFSGVNVVPEGQRGVCSDGIDWYGTWIPPRCSGNVAYRTEWVRYFKDFFEERLRLVELMPQKLHNLGHRLNDIDQEVDVNVYWKLAQELWGVDIRRAF
jgi:hypothetical protein